MRIHHFILGITLLASFGFGSLDAHAQDTSKKIDDTRLTSLYKAYLADPEDAFIQKKIDEEKEQIRNIIEEELNTLVAIPAEEEQIDDSGELSKALDRQRLIVQALQERLRERKIDLDLLKAEEEKFYTGAEKDTSSGTLDAFRTTKTHEGLLAKKAILGERIALLQTLIPHQQERLDRLIQDQRRQQFGILMDLGLYAVIILLIWLAEKLLRQFVFVRIPNISVRYTVIKIFSGGIYTITILWILGITYAKNPNIIASFAIVGAGIAIAMQDVIKDVVGWIVIHQGQLYSQGDRVSIGPKTGEVIDIGLLHTKVLEVGLPPEGVLEQTGKVLSIPNAKVLIEPLSNYNTTSDFVKSEMKFAITFESNWRKAEEILQEILQRQTEQFAQRDQMQHSIRTRTMYVPYEPSDARVFKDIIAEGVEFQLRFTVPVGKRRSVVSGLTDSIMEKFNAESDIELAYPTTRYYKRGEA